MRKRVKQKFERFIKGLPIKDKVVSIIFIIFCAWLLIGNMPVSFMNLNIEFENNIQNKNIILSYDAGNGYLDEDSLSNVAWGGSVNYFIYDKYHNVNGVILKFPDVNKDYTIKQILVYSRKNLVGKITKQEIYKTSSVQIFTEGGKKVPYLQLSNDVVQKYNKICHNDNSLKLEIFIPILCVYIIFMIRKFIAYPIYNYGWKGVVLLGGLIIYSVSFALIYPNIKQSTKVLSLNIQPSATTNIINADGIYKQTFRGNKNITGLSLHISSKARSQESKFTFELYDSKKDKLIYSYEILGKYIRANSYQNIMLDNITLSNDKEYYFTLRPNDYVQGQQISIYSDNGNNYSYGKLYYNGESVGKDLDFSLIEKGPNRFLILWTCITIFIVLAILVVLYKKLKVDNKKLIVAIYLIGFIFSAYKMVFYLQNSTDAYDELAHVSYVAYLSKNHDVIVPNFADMKMLIQYDQTNNQTDYYSISRLNFATGIYHGKFGNAINYLGHPPFYYHLMKITDSIHFKGDRIDINIIKLRVFNIGMVLVAISLMYYIGYTRIKKIPSIHLLFVLIINSVHMLTYEASKVNNDNLAVLGVTIFIYGCIRFIEKKYQVKTYSLIMLGLVITVLAKLTAGITLAIAAIIVLAWTLLSEKKLSSIINKKLLVTIPICLLAISYYVYVFFKEGTIQPSMSTYAPEQYMHNISVYKDVSIREQIPFFKFIIEFLNYFFSQWTSGVPGCNGKGSVFELKKIGTFLMWIAPFVLFLKSFIRKADSKIRLYISLFIGMLVVIFLQFVRAFKDFQFISGHGSYQSRYYVCMTLFFALVITYITEKFIKEEREILNLSVGEYNFVITNNQIAVFVCVLYSTILMYEGFIWIILNNPNYMLSGVFW